jgi:hypothetical protein
MAFDHTKATDIQKFTTTTAHKMAEESNKPHYNPDNLPLDEIPMVNGIWVRPETKQFVDELSKQFRGATFGVNGDCKAYWYKGAYAYQDMWLMLPDQPFALARVGFGNYSPRNSRSDNKTEYFMVYSRVINNEKYRAGSDQYYMSMSKDMAKAIVNARRYIRRYSPLDMATNTLRDITSNVENISGKVRRAWREAREQVVATDTGLPLLYQEIKRLVTTGHEFLDPKLKDMAVAWVEQEKAWAAEKQRPVPVYFVQVSTDFRDEQIFEVVEVEDIKPHGAFSSDFKDSNPPTKTYRAADIPEDIMGKLSVLSLLEPGQYTEGVGIRSSETMFWVERT